MNSEQTGTAGGSVTLLTEDGQKLTVDRQSAQQIGILKPMLAMQLGERATFPILSVKSTIMSKVVEYLEQHKSDPELASMDACKASPPLLSKTLASGSSLDDDDDDDGDDGGSGGRRPSPGAQEGSISDDSDGEEYVYEDYLAKVTPWDQKFADALDLPTLIEITKASNYLNIPGLLDLCCRTIAKHMTGLKAEELRKKFNLPNDFTPEEEAKMAAEFAWIED